MFLHFLRNSQFCIFLQFKVLYVHLVIYAVYQVSSQFNASFSYIGVTLIIYVVDRLILFQSFLVISYHQS